MPDHLALARSEIHPAARGQLGSRKMVGGMGGRLVGNGGKDVISPMKTNGIERLGKVTGRQSSVGYKPFGGPHVQSARRIDSLFRSLLFPRLDLLPKQSASFAVFVRSFGFGEGECHAIEATNTIHLL